MQDLHDWHNTVHALTDEDRAWLVEHGAGVVTWSRPSQADVMADLMLKRWQP